MNKHLFLLFFMSFYSYLFTEEVLEENSLVIEEECTEGTRCRRLYPRYNPDEEKLIEDRTEAHWPSKREDTILEQILHY